MLQYYEMKNGLQYKTDFKLKKILIPEKILEDHLIPAHGVWLWISTKPMSVDNLLKKQLVDFLNTPYTVEYYTPKHFRLPSQWEVDTFKIKYPQILTMEKLESMADSDTIKNPVYLVRSGFGKSSGAEF